MRAVRVMRAAGRSAAVLAVLALCGCEALAPRPKVEVATPTHAMPAPVALPASALNSGSIFQAAQYRPLFEDHRARLVGDTITVQIVENVSATQTSKSSIDKSGTVSAGVTAVPFVPPSVFSRARADGTSSNKFDGAGSTENTNDFTGTISATVTGVLPNGHLLISGEKQIGVNDNVDVLRFSGQVDPRSIQPGNTVTSGQIANVRLEHRGRGAQADSQVIGWLARFFLSVLPI
jgi:flagellar L-ring protein precursor FlgH